MGDDILFWLGFRITLMSSLLGFVLALAKSGSYTEKTKNLVIQHVDMSTSPYKHLFRSKLSNLFFETIKNTTIFCLVIVFLIFIAFEDLMLININNTDFYLDKAMHIIVLLVLIPSIYTTLWWLHNFSRAARNDAIERMRFLSVMRSYDLDENAAEFINIKQVKSNFSNVIAWRLGSIYLAASPFIFIFIVKDIFGAELLKIYETLILP